MCRCRQTTPRHVFGKRGQPREGLLDPRFAFDDETARTLTLYDRALVHQFLHRFAHRDARQTRQRRNLALWRKRVVRRQDTFGDAFLDALAQLYIKQARASLHPLIRAQKRGGGHVNFAF